MNGVIKTKLHSYHMHKRGIKFKKNMVIMENEVRNFCKQGMQFRNPPDKSDEIKKRSFQETTLSSTEAASSKGARINFSDTKYKSK